MLTDQQIQSKYGQPGDPSQLTTIELPYPMRIAWDKSKFVSKMQCHKLLAENFLNVFNQLKDHYGVPEIYNLGIDIFGGCLNVRLMRGSKKTWSRHSWAIAIDLHPEANQLKWGKDKALFANPEYQAMIDIFYKNGFINLGVEKGYDYMHFEAGS